MNTKLHVTVLKRMRPDSQVSNYDHIVYKVSDGRKAIEIMKHDHGYYNKFVRSRFDLLETAFYTRV